MRQAYTTSVHDFFACDLAQRLRALPPATHLSAAVFAIGGRGGGVWQVTPASCEILPHADAADIAADTATATATAKDKATLGPTPLRTSPSHADDEPTCILRANALDFLALVEGRMSVQDGLLTGRLQLAGDVVHLARWVEVLQDTPP